MADPRICSIENCDKPARSRGWCKSHYNKWLKYGNPEWKAKPANGEAYRFFRENVIPHRGDDCLVWPFCRDGKGYGRLHTGGRTNFVHRLACLEINGPPPSSKHVAAHVCGNGHLGCVNPLHVSWKTYSENMYDKNVHGTMWRGGSRKKSP